MNQLLLLLRDTWSFFRQNFWGIWYLIFPVVIPLSFMNSVVLLGFPYSEKLPWIIEIINVLFYPIVQAVIILYISSIYTGDYFSRTTCYQLAKQFWVPLIILYLVVTLAICIGLIFLIIPGLIVFVRLAFSEFYCVLYEKKPMDAFDSSWKQTNDYKWLIFSGLMVIIFVVGIPLLLIESYIEFSGLWLLFMAFILEVSGYLLSCLMTIFSFRVFVLHKEKSDRRA